MIFQWSKCLSPKNMERPFYKYFSWQMGDKFLGAVLHGGLMIRSCQGWRSFTNAFFSKHFGKLSVNIFQLTFSSKFLPIMKGYTLEDKALTSLQNYESCHIYGIWSSKEMGDTLKSSLAVAMQATRRDNFYGKERFSLCNTAVLKLYCKSYWIL